MRRLLTTAALALALASAIPTAQAAPPDTLHAWVGLETPNDLAVWVDWHLKEEQRLVTRIVKVQGPRTVTNTLALYDEAQFHLNLASGQTGIMFAVHPLKEIRDKAQALQQTIAAQVTALALNHDVYQALSAVDVTAADAATRHFKDRILLEYRLAGVDRDEATRGKIQKLQDQITETQLEFNRNMQDDVRKVQVQSVAELAGLPEDYLKRHTADANGVITLTTDEPDLRPVLSYATNARLRRQMLLAYTNRAYPANEGVLKDLLRERQDLASTLGFPHWADLATADMMIGSVTKMKELLREVDDISRDRSEKEYAAVEAFARKKDPSIDALTLSDSSYWTDQFKQSQYAFNSQSVRPYFAYAAVEAGILATAARLFHLEFREAKRLPVWSPAVHAYAVFDGGKPAGTIYLDMHPREGKDKWFSESTLIPGKHGAQLPEAVLVCNFTGGTDADPGLMQFNDVVTFFHEFGHMMHDVLGGKQRWAGQSGVSTESDFAEAPSQMLEEMIHDGTILQTFAKHYQTGEVLPQETIDRMNRASYFGRGIWVQAQLLYSNYSLQLHDQDPAKIDFQELWRDNEARFIRYRPVAGTHDFASFYHLTAYGSNYYTYVLDKVIAVDFFAQFDKQQILDGPTAMRYRREVLEPGGSKPAAEMIKNFLGREQNIDRLKDWMDLEYAPQP